MPKKKLIQFVFILITSSALANSEKINELDYHFLSPQYLRQVIVDTKDVIISPFYWDKYDMAIAAMVVTGTVALMTVDQPITEAFCDKKREPLHGILSVTDNFGYGYYAVPALFSVYFLGEYFHKRKVRKITLLSLESFTIAAGITQVGKYLFHRQRPRSKCSNQWCFDGPSLKQHHLSFPSGHTAGAFAIAGVIAEELKCRSLVIPAVAYSLASLTGLARIERNDHWASDVFFGACMGAAIGTFVSKLHRDCSSNSCLEVCFLPQKDGLQICLGNTF